MNSLTKIIQDTNTRTQVTDDCVIALEGEIKKKRGPIGMIVKKGHSTISKRNDGRMIPEAIDHLLDHFITVLDPFFHDFNKLEKSDKPGFSSYLVSRDREVTKVLLGVTDNTARQTDKVILAKAYNAIRPMAGNQVLQGVPVLGSIIEKYI